MLGNDQISPFEPSSYVFRGVYFVLVGFNPINKPKVLHKLVNGGGIDKRELDCYHTHVIVDRTRILYDDPICVAARRDGKILVTSLWVDYSFGAGMPQDTTSVVYRPMKSLNGIPGAQSLVICLTRYRPGDRLVIMVRNFFIMDLVTSTVTHLICNKFEGKNYDIAKKFDSIKIVNHRWLEDCLKAWEIVSDADYDKSGYDLKAEDKDSEKKFEEKYQLKFLGNARVALGIMRRENDRCPSEELAESMKILQKLEERLSDGSKFLDPPALLSQAVIDLRRANELFSTHINKKYGGKVNPEFFYEMILDVMMLGSQVALDPNTALKRIEIKTLARIEDYAFQYFRGLDEKDLDSEKPAAQDDDADASKTQVGKRPRTEKQEPEDKVPRWLGGSREYLGIGPAPGPWCVNCGLDHWAPERGMIGANSDGYERNAVTSDTVFTDV